MHIPQLRSKKRANFYKNKFTSISILLKLFTNAAQTLTFSSFKLELKNFNNYYFFKKISFFKKIKNLGTKT